MLLMLEQAPNHLCVEGLWSVVMRVQQRTRIDIARQQHSQGQRARMKAARLVEQGWLDRAVQLKLNKKISSFWFGARLDE